jgi:hypothetical protein
MPRPKVFDHVTVIMTFFLTNIKHILEMFSVPEQKAPAPSDRLRISVDRADIKDPKFHISTFHISTAH